MTTAPGVWLGDLTWPEAKERFDAGAVVLVPIGAGSKEHGHHLPLKTDYLLARELSERVIAALPVVVAPVVTLGYFPAFVRYPGSQHLRSETFIALLKDVFAKLARDGVQNLAVINTGVSTEAPLRVVVRDIYEACGLRVNTADIRALGLDVEATMEQKLGGHGDESETSMILAIEPDSVRMERAEVDYGHGLDIPKTVFYQPGVFDGDESSGLNYSKTGVRGDPTLATAAKGEALLSAMAKELVEGLRLALSGRARVSWDVVVIGYGYAGAMAAIEARDAGASVLLLEKMAEPGGISICSAGGVRIAFDAEGALDYLEATNAGTTPTSVLRGLAEGMVEPPDRLRELARVNGAGGGSAIRFRGTRALASRRSRTFRGSLPRWRTRTFEARPRGRGSSKSSRTTCGSVVSRSAGGGSPRERELSVSGARELWLRGGRGRSGVLFRGGVPERSRLGRGGAALQSR